MKRVLLFFLIFAIATTIGYNIITKPPALPIINPNQINPSLVDSTLQTVYRDHRIGSFNLINQFGEPVTEETTKGKIYVTDFFFTRCKTICPVMSQNLERVQEAFSDEERFLIMSHSVTPKLDTPSALLDYSYMHGAIDDKWHFLTGTKKEIYRIARKEYFVVLDEGDGGLQDFIHTENFALIDEKNRIRGYYDGTLSEEIDRLIIDIDNLLDHWEE